MSLINYEELWQHIRKYARQVGRASARPVILLYYVMQSDKTPRKDKLTILSALAYLVLPIDLIDARRMPIIGWLDEVVSLSVAYERMCQYITRDMKRRADELLDKWFPNYVDYVEVVES